MAKNVSLNEVVIVSAVRTPIGSFRGSLAGVSATQLGAVAIKAAVERAGVPKEEIKEVIMGNVISANLGQAPARQAAIFGGLPSSTICTTINKVCSSGTKALMLGVQGLETGAQDVILAGGMESLSNVPFYMIRGETPYGGMQLLDGILRDGFHDAYAEQFHMGHCAEHTAKTMGISREEQDEYAIASYKKSAAAWKAKAFADELVPVPVPQGKGETVMFSEDEEYKKVNFEKFTKLPTVFQTENGTVTAGNACPLNDGAAALVMMTREAAVKLKVTPIAKVVGYADGERNPVDFCIAPSVAIPNLLKKTGVKKEDVTLWEINEPFAVVGIGNSRILNIDPAKINVHGGALSLGHPIGCSGARLVTHLCYALEKGEKGVACVCNGGGGSSAMMIEKL